MKYNYHGCLGEGEVFDNFCKIIKEAEDKKQEDIYDLEVDETDLLDQAHPDKAETVDSYVFEGGVVENLKEQQEKDIEIALRNPSGQISANYRKAELLETLLSIAEEMDIRGQQELSKYADECADKIYKEAVLPAALPVSVIAPLVAIPVLAGAYFYSVHFSDPVSMGVEKNIQSAILMLNKYKSENAEKISNSNTIELINETIELVEGLQKTFFAFNKKTSEMFDNLKSLTGNLPKTKEEIEQAVSKTKENLNPQTQELIKNIDALSKKYEEYLKKFIQELRKNIEILKAVFANISKTNTFDDPERTTWRQLVHTLGRMTSIFYKQDETQVVEALEVLAKSLEEDLNLRIMEKARIVSRLTDKFKSDISEQF